MLICIETLQDNSVWQVKAVSKDLRNVCPSPTSVVLFGIIASLVIKYYGIEIL